MSQPSILQQAALFLNEVRFEQLPAPAVKTAKLAILDYIGVAIPGSQQPVAQNLLRWAQQRHWDDSASTLFTNHRLDPENAALVNAAAGHALDFDDTSWATIGHPTTVIVPALLALCQQHNLSGQQLITAYISGVEVSHKIADLIMPMASENGWHTTGIFYALGTAAAASQLLQLTEVQSTEAMALALSRSSGIRSNFGTQAKPYHAGMAAKAGLEAVSLIQAGITASPTALEGVDGFIQCFGDLELAESIRTLSEPVPFGVNWDICTRGYAFKGYPNCSGNHPACDLILELIAREHLAWQQIERIDAGVSLLGPKELVCDHPNTPVEARFSLQFALSAALVYGQITLQEFTEEKIQDARIQEMMPRIQMAVDPELAKLGFIGTAPIKLKIHLKDGQVIDAENDLARGNPEKPFSDDEFAEKFRRCCQAMLPTTQLDALLNALFELDQQKDMEALIQLTCPQ